MKATLQQELDVLDQFVALLQREQRALVDADAPALPAIAQEKLRLGEQLNRLAGTRLAAVAAAGFATDTAGTRQWLAQQPAAIVLLWDQLMDRARAAQQLNQTNGKLIETRLQHNQQALNALLQAANQAGVYGPDGQPQPGMTSATRSIGKV